ncbi:MULTISPECIES: hypothetical protein [unclassified Crossiella]|uniref:hypothetical protein n=1 Tax=unclassified Crossiella TaxID=2620835 RepID=UPI001FFFBED2|nr:MULTISPECIES: hypothetical protein [unclassified Crossiella]MCK2236485.1 hypothetical protein [Crossiella sp. S99.2]MCK2250152.1 hypothetical protein [Crossiella sp. S99.1]
MDEHKLADALRDAVREVPPPSFNEQDVVTASHQASARQRKLILSGSTFGAALLLGGTLVVSNLLGPEPTPANTASSGEATAEGGVLRGPGGDASTADPGTSRSNPKTSPDVSKQGETSASAGPSAGGTEGCGMADRKLAAALAVELPAVTSLPLEQPQGELCTAPGSRGVALKLPDGVLTVVLGPDGGPMARNGQAFEGPERSRGYTAHTAKGAPLTVSSKPAKGKATPPYAAELERLAKALSEVF